MININTITPVSNTNLNSNNPKQQHELYTTYNKIHAESKLFTIILEEYIKRGGQYASS